MNHPPVPLRILVGGAPLASVGQCRITEKRELLPVGDYTSDRPAALACAGIHYEIELTRVEPWREGLSDGISLRSLDHFELGVERGAHTDIYGGCRIAELTESVDQEGAYERVRLLALSRRDAQA